MEVVLLKVHEATVGILTWLPIRTKQAVIQFSPKKKYNNQVIKDADNTFHQFGTAAISKDGLVLYNWYDDMEHTFLSQKTRNII